MNDVKSYKVERLFTYGWDDADWAITEPDGPRMPWRFATPEEARAEIAEFCKLADEDESEFRVVEE